MLAARHFGDHSGVQGDIHQKMSPNTGGLMGSHSGCATAADPKGVALWCAAAGRTG
ncbi:hypothetical protein MOKP76_17280 [Mycobacterium avium subsp. hominissuis]